MENFTRNQSFYTTSTTSVVWFSEEDNKSIPMACLYAVISFIAVFGNLLVITAVCRDHTLRSYTSNYFLANLAVADFFQGLIAIPLRILEVMAVGYNPNVFCRIAIATAILFGSSSNLAILVISIDRFFAVQYPYTYVRYSNIKCSDRLFVVGGWVVEHHGCYTPGVAYTSCFIKSLPLSHLLKSRLHIRNVRYCSRYSNWYSCTFIRVYSQSQLAARAQNSRARTCCSRK